MKAQQDYNQLQQNIAQRCKEPFELNDYDFQQAYWPVRDASLQILKVSENYISRKLTYYQWKSNKGVIVRKILMPQGYQISCISVPTSKPVTTDPVQLYQQSLDVPQAVPVMEDENEFMNILRNLTEIKVNLLKWKVLTLNPDLTILPVENFIIENEVLTIVQQKGHSSLEDMILERIRTKSQFSLIEVAHVTFQLAKYLTLLEFKRDAHVNLQASNLIFFERPKGEKLDIKLNDFGVRPLYLRLYFEITKRHLKPQANTQEQGKSKSELAIVWLFEKELLNRALVNELLKHKQSDELEETIKSLLLFYDRIIAVITILRMIRLIPQDEFNKVVESWFETAQSRNVIDLRFVQMRLSQLLNANQQFFQKLLVPVGADESLQKTFQLFLTSLNVLLGPPDFVIADKLTKENIRKNDPKKVSVKNIRVAYQTMMTYHDNSDYFPFVTKKDDEKRNSSALINKSTVTFIHQNMTEEKKPQKVASSADSVEYTLYFTNKFAGAQTVLEKTEFVEIRKQFAHLYLKQSFNTYEQNIFDVHNDDDLTALLRYMKQDQGPKPVKLLIQRQDQGKQNKLIIFRMNSDTLQFMSMSKAQRKSVLSFPKHVYVEVDIYNLDESVQWVKFLRDSQIAISLKFNNIHKVGEQQALKLSQGFLGYQHLQFLEIKMLESMITDKWLLETLIICLNCTPSIITLIINVSGNFFQQKKDDPDLEMKLSKQNLQRIYKISKETNLENFTLLLSSNNIDDRLLTIMSDYLTGLINLDKFSLDLSQNEVTETSIKVLLNKISYMSLEDFTFKINKCPNLNYQSLNIIRDLLIKDNQQSYLRLELEGLKVGMRGTDILLEAFTPKEVVKNFQKQESLQEEYESEEEVEEPILDQQHSNGAQTPEKSVQTKQQETPSNDTEEASPDGEIYEIPLDEDYAPVVKFKRLDGQNDESNENNGNEEDSLSEQPEKQESSQKVIKVKRKVSKLRRVTRTIEIPMTEKVSLRLESLILNFSQSGLGDDGLGKIAEVISSISCLNVLDLNLEKNQITHLGSNRMFVHLQSLTQLQSISLNLRTNDIGETGMEKFARLKCLEFVKYLSLNLYNNQLGTKGAAVLGLSISKLPSLLEISLDLGMNVISDGFFILFGTILSTSQILERFNLDLTLNPLDKEPGPDKIEWPLRNLAKKSNIQGVYLSLQQVSGLSEEQILLTSAIIGSLTHLQKLGINYYKTISVTGGAIKGLEGFALCLNELQQLTELNLNCQKTRVSDQEIEILTIQIPRLAKLKKLHLNLQENDIRIAAHQFSAKLGQLAHLIYLRIDLSKNMYMDIETCHQLVQNLASTKSLECLDIQMRDMSITDDQIIQTGKMLKRIDSLLVLNMDFSGNHCRERGAIQLGTHLNQMSRLKALTIDLGLRKNNIIYDASQHYRELMSKLIFYRFM